MEHRHSWVFNRCWVQRFFTRSMPISRSPPGPHSRAALRRTFQHWRTFFAGRHGTPIPQANRESQTSSTRSELRHLTACRRGRVARGSPGQRKPALSYAAWKLGQWVAAGALDQGEVEDALHGAAERNGLVADDGQRQWLATIRSGLGAGARSRAVAELSHPAAAVGLPLWGRASNSPYRGSIGAWSGSLYTDVTGVVRAPWCLHEPVRPEGFAPL